MRPTWRIRRNDNIDTPLFISSNGEERLIDDDDAFAMLLVRSHTDHYKPYLQIEVHEVYENNYDDLVSSTLEMEGYYDEESERFLRSLSKKDVEVLSYNSEHIPACLFGGGIDGYVVAVKDFSGNVTLVYCSTDQCYSKCIADNERMYPIRLDNLRDGTVFLDIDTYGKYYAEPNYTRELYEVSCDTVS